MKRVVHIETVPLTSLRKGGFEVTFVERIKEDGALVSKEKVHFYKKLSTTMKETEKFLSEIDLSNREPKKPDSTPPWE